MTIRQTIYRLLGYEGDYNQWVMTNEHYAALSDVMYDFDTFPIDGPICVPCWPTGVRIKGRRATIVGVPHEKYEVTSTDYSAVFCPRHFIVVMDGTVKRHCGPAVVTTD